MRMLYSQQPTFLLAWWHLNKMLLTNFENLSSISYIFQETHDFLVFTDPLIVCIYLRTTHRHLHDQGNVLHATSKLLKCDLVQILNTFRNPSLRIFAAEKASLVFYKRRLQPHLLSNLLCFCKTGVVVGRYHSYELWYFLGFRRVYIERSIAAIFFSPWSLFQEST